ncbi:MAG TPA: glycosyltransferase, partial [Chloroflexota bacterium]|nr:glycosyltransferase [Chloroflexota bacterium]
MERISVILITLNEVAVVGRCLAHLQLAAMADGAVEVIVSDGGSTDGTVEVARAYAPVV